MKTYKYIEYDNEVDNNILLQELLDNCDFIVTSYNCMYSKDGIECIGHSLRGSVIRFKGGTMTYYYNIIGGYMLEK